MPHKSIPFIRKFKIYFYIAVFNANLNKIFNTNGAHLIY